MHLDQCFLLPFSIPCSLSSVPSQDLGRAHCSEGQNKLLSLIEAWRVPPEGASLPLVQSAKDLKEILCTAAAFLQGLWGAGTQASTVSCCSVPGTLSLPLSWFLFSSKLALGVFWAVSLEAGLADPLSLSLYIPYSKSFPAFSPVHPFSALSQGSSACRGSVWALQ